MIFSRVFSDELWCGNKHICLFVIGGSHIWVLDDKSNFILDAEKDYRAYLDKGNITKEQYEGACGSFRGGVLRLSAENFDQYLSGGEAEQLSCNELRDLFFQDEMAAAENVLGKVEKYYCSGQKLLDADFAAANFLACRLPTFYINFDRKIYMHMDSGRFHESLSYPDWISRCADFGCLVSDSDRYWMYGGRDYWKLKFLQSS